MNTNVKFPTMVRLRQHFDRPRVDDVAGTVQDQLRRLEIDQKIRPGQTVALTAGSRGIANIPVILQSTVQFLKELGARPFLVPTMGSHGGGTAEGQREVLESYGITEQFVGAPIKASMEVITLGKTDRGFPVYLDRRASEADHIGVVARIKPHTGFHGPIESGLFKMMLIGLGKHVGALEYHRILLDEPYDPIVRAVGKTMLGSGRIAFGMGIVENAYDETAYIEAVRPENFEKREEEMLVMAKHSIPRLPFHDADLLIVDEIGKDISGSGMDTNVVGRKRAFKSDAPANQPEMRFIFVRGLSERTHGNAAGIGFADFTTKRLVDGMNYKATVINCVTSGYPDGANLPVHYETDQEVLQAALPIVGNRPTEKARIIRIHNTLDVEEVEVSTPCLKESKVNGKYDILGDPYEISFDDKGNLLPL